jgi:hypothetical protein
MRRVVLLSVIVSLTACVPPSQSRAVAPFRFVFVSEGCFGTCPVYNLRVGATGIATLEAKEFVSRPGIFRGRIAPAALRSLIAQHHVFDREVTPANGDLRVVSIEVLDDGTTLSVRGSAIRQPVELMVPLPGSKIAPNTNPLLPFTDALDALVARTEWTPVAGG